MTAEEYRQYLKQQATTNKKVKNAHKSERDGVKFQSNLEKTMFDLLRLFNIPFEFQKTYVVQDGFNYNGKKILPITYTIDFYLPAFDCVIDTKGQRTQQGDIRIKMLKRLFATQGVKTAVYIPKDERECSGLINKLIQKRKELNK